MAFRLPPYLQWRNGRPRWEPGPRLRSAFKGKDLKDSDGKWLGLEAAIAAARELNAAVDAWRRGAPPLKRTIKARASARTVEQLWELWASPADPDKASPRWQRLADSTRADYAMKARVFREEFSSDPVAALRKQDLYDWWEDLYRDRGHAMANGCVAVARAMLSYAVLKGWRSDNPAKELQLIGVPPRVVTWTPAEAAAFVAKADSMDLHGIADAVVIALHTGQRRSDVLSFEMPEAEKGRARFRQRKTGARVSVPYTPPLRERITAIQTRRRAGAVAELQIAGPLVRDTKGRVYTRENFGRDFRTVREGVAAALPDMANKQFMDLRDTAVTRLALAGCTLIEIAAITGHTLESITSVLKHYLALSDRMADTAIDRLKSWMTAEGVAI